MSLLTDEFAAVFANAQQPRISLCQPTHRRRRDNLQKVARGRNLLNERERSLQQQYLEAEVASFLAPFDAHEHDVAYWQKMLDEQAVSAAPVLFEVFETPRPDAKLAAVADTFHTRSLLRSVNRS